MATVVWGRLAATPVYLITRVSFALAFALFATLASVRRVVDAGLNPLELVLVGTLLEVTVLIFEVPTGVVADVFGRRLSVVVGYVLIGVGIIIESLTLEYRGILLAQVVWGIGVTFISGAQEAWIADEIGAERVGPVFLRGAQGDQIGTLAGIAAATLLGTFALALPLRVGGILMVLLAGFLAMTMPERRRASHRDPRQSWHALRQTVSDGVRTVRRQRVLIAILAIAVSFGMASEGIDRLWEIHFLTNVSFPAAGGLTMVVWFGALRASALLLSLAATETVHRTVDVNDPRRAGTALLALNVMVMAGVVALALATSFVAGAVAYLLITVGRRLIDPIFDTWTNQQLESSTRATVLSIRNQSGALGEILSGPLLGGVALGVSIRAALVGAGLLLTPALALYTWALRATRR